jgi:hypothetical protein
MMFSSNTCLFVLFLQEENEAAVLKENNMAWRTYENENV